MAQQTPEQAEAPTEPSRPLSTRQAFLSEPVPAYVKHLPTDKRGFPVPHVAEWTDEGPEAEEKRRSQGAGANGYALRRMDLRRFGSPYAETICLYPHGEQRQGVPRLAILQPGRQMDCMIERRCQVCSRLISTNEPAVFVGGSTEVELTGPLSFREPPLHKRCAVFALFACPGINKAPVYVVECPSYGLQPEAFIVDRNDPRPEAGGIEYRWPHEVEGGVLALIAIPLGGTVFTDIAAYREENKALMDAKPKPQRGKRKR